MGPGGVRNDGGTVWMNDSSSIEGNRSAWCAGVLNGGRNGKYGTFTMNESSSINGNETWADGSGEGGGVCVGFGRFTMTGASTITGNTAAARWEDDEGTYGGGGGVHQTAAPSPASSAVPAAMSPATRPTTATSSRSRRRDGHAADHHSRDLAAPRHRHRGAPPGHDPGSRTGVGCLTHGLPRAERRLWQDFTALQSAVDAAKKDDRLTVRGTCHGNTVLDKGVVIEGMRTTTRPLLAGDHQAVVLTVRKGVTVTVEDLAIEGGRGHVREGGSEKPYNWPAGVLNHGNLTLRSVRVKENHGIGIENTGRLRLKGDTLVRENGSSSVTKHEGIHNSGTLRLNGTASVRSPDEVENDGILVMNGASSVNFITNRGTATLNDSAGASVTNRGTLTLNDQSLGSVGNYGKVVLNDASRLSGVVFNHDGATMTLTGSSSVVGSYGVYNHGTLTLNGSSSIREGHVGPSCGGGGYCTNLGPIGGGGVTNSGTLILNDASTISGNSVQAWSAGRYGGGVYMVRYFGPPSLTMTGSSTITGNTAGQGGGIYAVPGSVLNGVVCGPGGNVYGNSPDDCYFEP